MQTTRNGIGKKKKSNQLNKLLSSNTIIRITPSLSDYAKKQVRVATPSRRHVSADIHISSSGHAKTGNAGQMKSAIPVGQVDRVNRDYSLNLSSASEEIGNEKEQHDEAEEKRLLRTEVFYDDNRTEDEQAPVAETDNTDDSITEMHDSEVADEIRNTADIEAEAYDAVGNADIETETADATENTEVEKIVSDAAESTDIKAEASDETEKTDIEAETSDVAENTDIEPEVTDAVENTGIVTMDELTSWGDVAEHVQGEVTFIEDKNEIELGWRTYSSERELLSRWLVPSEDNPLPGKYTLTIQSPYSKTTIIRETKPNAQFFSEDWILHYTKEEYIDELDRLLGFMTEYDRDKIVQRYRTMLFMTEDSYKMMQALGSPQELAATFANDYVASKESKEEELKRDVKQNERVFRSVAASYHMQEHEKKETELTTFVDLGAMSDKESLESGDTESVYQISSKNVEETEAVRDNGNVTSIVENTNGKREEGSSHAPFAWIIFSGIVKMVFCVCLVAALVTLGLAVAFAVLKAWVKIYAALPMQDLLLAAGISVTMLAIVMLLITLGLNLFFYSGRRWKSMIKRARNVEDV